MIQANELHAKTEWQRIFLQSKVNGAPYEEQESGVTWPWPEDTYLQRRLNHLRTCPSSDTPQESKQASDQNGPRVVDCGGWSSVFWATGETQRTLSAWRSPQIIGVGVPIPLNAAMGRMSKMMDRCSQMMGNTSHPKKDESIK